jgi:methyl-accepting chemotaxis protein
VKEGVDLVAETGQGLGRIMGQVTDVSSIVRAIATTAQEQATGLDEVNTAARQMDQITQQNAAMVEEATAATRTLVSQVEQLSSRIGTFRLSGGADVVAMPAGGRVATLRDVRSARAR